MQRLTGPLRPFSPALVFLAATCISQAVQIQPPQRVFQLLAPVLGPENYVSRAINQEAMFLCVFRLTAYLTTVTL